MIPIYVGFDQRESIAYHTFCQSVIARTSEPVSFVPLALNALKGYTETHTDGSNAFIYSRFLVPHLQNYQGWAMFADGDMICCEDIAKLWALRDESKAVMVVKHDYETKYPIKYLGNKNSNYPRKNWSSVILFNCAHPANQALTKEYVENNTGATLHRFSWLTDELIGELPIEWNWLDAEFEYNEDAKLIHYTIGTPCFADYQDGTQTRQWWEEYMMTIMPLAGNHKESYA